MNTSVVFKTIGIFLIFLAVTMGFPMLWAAYYHEDPTPFLLSIGITAGAGGILFFIFRKRKGAFSRKEGFAVVGLGWIFAALFGALPYMFSGTFDSFTDAYFETMSGFTTTGASVATDIEAISKSVLFWRSLTHWLGGMGIIVLFVAIFPFLGVSGRHLFHSETPGPDSDSLRPKISETARLLWLIYCGLSILETGLLMLGGMSFFESLCHTFGTMATGGFSTRQASIGAYESAYIEWVIIVFMLAAGLNFSLYYHMIRRRFGRVARDAEFKTYGLIFLAATTLVTFSVVSSGCVNGVWEGIRTAAFQTASILTTTGYCTADSDQWPWMVKCLLIVLMFIGGCAGSTGGGMKVIRVVILMKVMLNEIVQRIHPGAVLTIKLGRVKVDERVASHVVGFFILAMAIFVASTLFLAMYGIDMITALSAVAATLWNIGPGFGEVGATQNYAFLPTGAKLLLSHCMLLGRLELFTVIVFLVPSFWRR